MTSEYAEQRVARERAAERRELARGLATAFRASRDEDDFVTLWQAITGREDEDEARRFYFGMLPWNINKVRTVVFSFKKTNNTFSVNDLIALMPEEDYPMAGKAVRSLRGVLEPAGWTAAALPTRKGGAVRTWRFRSDGQ